MKAPTSLTNVGFRQVPAETMLNASARSVYGMLLIKLNQRYYYYYYYYYLAGCTMFSHLPASI